MSALRNGSYSDTCQHINGSDVDHAPGSQFEATESALPPVPCDRTHPGQGEATLSQHRHIHIPQAHACFTIQSHTTKLSSSSLKTPSEKHLSLHNLSPPAMLVTNLIPAVSCRTYQQPRFSFVIFLNDSELALLRPPGEEIQMLWPLMTCW